MKTPEFPSRFSGQQAHHDDTERSLPRATHRKNVEDVGEDSWQKFGEEEETIPANEFIEIHPDDNGNSHKTESHSPEVSEEDPDGNLSQSELLGYREKMHENTKGSKTNAKRFERTEYEESANQHEYESALKFKKIKEAGIDIGSLTDQEFRELLGQNIELVKKNPGSRRIGIKKFPIKNWFESLATRMQKHPRGMKELDPFYAEGDHIESEKVEKPNEIYEINGPDWQEAEVKVPKGFTKEEWRLWVSRIYREWLKGDRHK